MRADLTILGRTDARKPLECARPFARAVHVLRAADALIERRPLRRSRMPPGLLVAADRAQEEELRLISQQLRQAVKTLRGTAEEKDSHGLPRR